MEKFLKKLLVLVAVLVIVILAILSVSNNYSVPQPQKLSLEQEKNWVGQYLSGQYAIRQNEYGKAANFFLESIDVKPTESGDLSFQVLELLIASGKIEDAIKLAETINKNGEDDESASSGLLLYANQMKDNNYDGAIEILNALPKEAKQTVIHKILLAWAQIGAKDNKSALKTLESIKKQDYFQTLINFNYALMAEIAGENAKAAELYNKFISTDRIPVKIAENAYRFYIKIDNQKAAAKILDSGAKLSEFQNQDNPPSSRMAAADALNEVAAMLLTEQNFSKAAVFFRIGLLMNSESEEAAMLLATILSHEKDPKGANEIFSDIPENSQFYHEAKMAMAQNLITMEKEIQAKTILTKLAEVKSTKIEALMTLGDLSRQHEDFAAANKYYTQAINVIENRKNKDIFWPLYFARAVTFERQKKWEQAEKDFIKALELEPNQPDILNYYAYSLLDMNLEERYDEAKEMLLRAHAASPDDPHIIDSIGWAWFKKGNYKKAVKHLERAAAEMPFDPTINDHLGDIYWQLGRENEAYFAWQRALDNNPEERFIEPLKNKLANGLDKSKKTPQTNEINPTQTIELEVQNDQFQDSRPR